MDCVYVDVVVVVFLDECLCNGIMSVLVFVMVYV